VDVSEIYRVVFETVRQDRLKEFCNADPAHYTNVSQVVPNSAIPEDAWYEVRGIATEAPWDQHATLVQWAAADKEFVRNVRLEKLASPEVWEAVS
jgi:hypothetical protein